MIRLTFNQLNVRRFRIVNTWNSVITVLHSFPDAKVSIRVGTYSTWAIVVIE